MSGAFFQSFVIHTIKKFVKPRQDRLLLKSMFANTVLVHKFVPLNVET